MAIVVPIVHPVLANAKIDVSIASAERNVENFAYLVQNCANGNAGIIDVKRFAVNPVKGRVVISLVERLFNVATSVSVYAENHVLLFARYAIEIL